MSEWVPTTKDVEDAFAETFTESVSEDARAAFRRWLKANNSGIWGEGVSDGVWNHEHEYMILYGIREEIKNPYLA